MGSPPLPVGSGPSCSAMRWLRAPSVPDPLPPPDVPSQIAFLSPLARNLHGPALARFTTYQERTPSTFLKESGIRVTRSPIADSQTLCRESLRYNARMKVSVFMTTYNHERFIEQALKSILAQEVTFDYEIVVGEDCSTDGTREILMDYHRRYPNRIVPLLRDRNIGAVANAEATRAACKGQYLAFLEGDDYWMCKHKLQRQIDFLDSHRDYAICCTRAQILSELSTTETAVLPNLLPAGSYTIEDLVKENFIMTCTAVYRWGVPMSPPKWFHKMAMSDWPLHVLMAKTGKIHLMDDVMATYRLHDGGIWSSLPVVNRLRETIRVLKALDKHLEYEYSKAIQATILQCYLELTRIAREESDRVATGKYVMGCMRNGGWQLLDRRRKLAAYAAYSLMGSWYKIFSKSNLKSGA
jgi:Glycosyl transferase family 2